MMIHRTAYAVLTLLVFTIMQTSVLADEKDGKKGTKSVKQVYPVAVLPFTERGREVKELGGKVTDLVFAELITNPELFLVDREDLKKILQEQELTASGLANPAEANKLGQLTGAKILVTGSVLQVGRKLYLVAKVIGTETSRVVGASVKGSENDDLGDLAAQLAKSIVKTIDQRADQLVAKVVTREDRLAATKKALGKAKRPSVWVHITEEHVGQTTIDPAAETEITKFLTESGFLVIDSQEGSKSQADILVIGEGFSEFATRHGNLLSVKARLEVKAIDRKTAKIISIDRQTTVAVDLTEQIAGKTALQAAAVDIAVRLLPQLVNGKKAKKKRASN